MAERTPFTPGMKDVMRFSRAEAGRLNHDYIGPEHYLLGIIRKSDGLAIQALGDLGVDLESLKSDIEKRVGMGKGAPPLGIYNPTEDAKKVIEDSKEIALGFRHSWIGTEHLLLALIRAEATVPGQELRAFGVTCEAAEATVQAVIDEARTGISLPPPVAPARRHGPSVIVERVVLHASAPELCEMFLNPETHAAITGAPAVIGPEPGARFEAFNGMLTGRILEVLPGRRIVMSWRSGKWTADDVDSTLVLTFSPVDDDDKGCIAIVHIDVPEHDFWEVKRGWKRHYWEPWMKWLEKR